MAKDFDNTDRGVLFKNDKKSTEKHPDYKGQINVGGAEFWLSAWIKKSESGKTFMSLSIQPKDAERSDQRRPAQKGGPVPLDDEIPFAPEWR